MLAKNNINKLIYLTIGIDILLFTILFIFKLNYFDFYFVIITLIIHLMFIYFLLNYNKQILYIFHVFVFILIGIGLFIENKYLLIVPLILITIIRLLWDIEEKCILNEDNTDFLGDKNIKFVAIIVSYCYVWKLSRLFYKD